MLVFWCQKLKLRQTLSINFIFVVQPAHQWTGAWDTLLTWNIISMGEITKFSQEVSWRQKKRSTQKEFHKSFWGWTQVVNVHRENRSMFKSLTSWLSLEPTIVLNSTDTNTTCLCWKQCRKFKVVKEQFNIRIVQHSLCMVYFVKHVHYLLRITIDLWYV